MDRRIEHIGYDAFLKRNDITVRAGNAGVTDIDFIRLAKKEIIVTRSIRIRLSDKVTTPSNREEL